MYEKLSSSGGVAPTPTTLPLDPAGGSAPRLSFRLAFRALAMVRRPLPFGKSLIRHCTIPRRRQTDRQTCHGITALCVASRGRN